MSERPYTLALEGDDAEGTNAFIEEFERQKRTVPLTGNLDRPVLQAKLFGVTVSIPINWLRLPDRKIDYVVFELAPGEGFDRHLHGYGEELYVVLSGSGIVEIDGVEHDAREHDVFHLAVGVVHTIWNPSDRSEPFRFLLVNGPSIAYHLRRSYWSMFVGDPLDSVKTER